MLSGQMSNALMAGIALRPWRSSQPATVLKFGCFWCPRSCRLQLPQLPLSISLPDGQGCFHKCERGPCQTESWLDGSYSHAALCSFSAEQVLTISRCQPWCQSATFGALKGCVGLLKLAHAAAQSLSRHCTNQQGLSIVLYTFCCRDSCVTAEFPEANQKMQPSSASRKSSHWVMMVHQEGASKMPLVSQQG